MEMVMETVNLVTGTVMEMAVMEMAVMEEDEENQ